MTYNSSQFFLAPTLADYNINVNDDNNVAGSGQQSVSVNNEHNVANIDNNDGWNSWNAIWDYKTDFAAVRLFQKKSCIVHKMNKDAMPSIEVLNALAKQNKLQGKGPEGTPTKGLKYSVNPNQVNDLKKFGQNIASMCRGIPTYLAEETQEASLFFESGKCFKADILWILNISFCAGEVEN
uniref:Gastrokine 1 n=1 Tax=Propithecus coquereli TaxID=379532 RepID=A0A2K6F266_PROCO